MLITQITFILLLTLIGVLVFGEESTAKGVLSRWCWLLTVIIKLIAAPGMCIVTLTYFIGGFNADGPPNLFDYTLFSYYLLTLATTFIPTKRKAEVEIQRQKLKDKVAKAYSSSPILTTILLSISANLVATMALPVWLNDLAEYRLRPYMYKEPEDHYYENNNISESEDCPFV